MASPELFVKTEFDGTSKLTNYLAWLPTRSQFHQCSMRSFYVHKFREQLFCAFILGSYFIGTRMLAQKLHIERWWNWTQMAICLLNLNTELTYPFVKWQLTACFFQGIHRIVSVVEYHVLFFEVKANDLWIVWRARLDTKSW